MEKKEKIQHVIECLGNVTALFYQNKITEGYQRLEELFASLSILLDGLYQDGTMEAEDTSVLEILKEVMGAMEQKDSLLVADLLEYELKEALLRL